MEKKYFYYVALCAIFFLAFFLRFYNLSHIPPGIHGDEAEWGLIEEKVNNGLYNSFFSLGNTGQYFDFSILSYFVQGLFLHIFGNTVFGIRASSAFAGSVTVFGFYFLCNKIFKNKLISILLTLALATSHYHIAYSRLALSNIWTPLFLVLIMYYFYQGLTHKKLYNYAFAGFLLGLSLYFQHTVKAIPIILICCCIVALFHRYNNWQKVSLSFLLVFIVACIIFAPQAQYYLSHPDTFSPRLNTVSILNHLPEYYARYNVHSLGGVLFWQFVNTMKVFFIGGDIGFFFYGYQGGLLAPIIATVAGIGLLLSVIKIRSEEYQFLLIWFFIIIFLGGVFTIDAPSSQRILGTIPVLFLFAGITLKYIFSLRWKKKYIKLLVILLFLINSFWDYNIYFIHYAHSQDGWAQREPATQVAYYLKSLGPTWKAYMLRENTWLYFHHGTIRFIDPSIEGQDVDSSQDEIPIREKTNKNIVYIMPPNSSSLVKIKQLYPKGNLKHFNNLIDQTPSFDSYEIKNSSLYQHNL